MMADATPSLGTAGNHSPTHKTSSILFWIIVAVITILGVFVLPFKFPPAIPSYSSSYTYGFGNRIAGIAASAIGALVVLALWLRRVGRSPAAPKPASRLPLRWLLYAVLAAILFTAIFGGILIHANYFYDDASYIQLQLYRSIHDHATLYRDFQWPYGPLLFLWPRVTILALAPLGISPAVSYMVTLALQQTVGICLLFYILRWLPLSRRLCLFALVLFTFGTLNAILGLNYTLFRFLIAPGVFLFVIQRRSLAVQTLLFTLGELLVLGTSPEAGLAFLVGVAAYALYRAFTTRPAFLVAAIPPAIAFIAFIAYLGKDYLAVLRNFSSGAFNMVVEPQFNILVLLVAAVALAPIAVAPYLRDKDPRAPAILGFYFIALVMLGPAFGRADALHTFYGGLGVYLLSLLVIDRITNTLAAKIWLLALFLTVAYHQFDKTNSFRPMLVQILFHSPTDQDGVNMDRLEALTHGQPIATPIEIPQRVMQLLQQRNQFVPSFYVYMGEVWDAKAEQRKIDEMRQANFALIPNGNLISDYGDPDSRRRIRIFRLGYNYHRIHTPYQAGAMITTELQTHWTPVESVGKFTVYRKLN
jgi:hypothetical protein